ncbi:hypothetical protein D3C71_2251400 [compost metagenome]
MSDVPLAICSVATPVSVMESWACWSACMAWVLEKMSERGGQQSVGVLAHPR